MSVAIHNLKVFFLGICVMLFALSPLVLFAGAEKVYICHNYTGTNPRTLHVSIHSWPAHRAHSDILGPCPAEIETDDHDEDEKDDHKHSGGGSGTGKNLSISSGGGAGAGALRARAAAINAGYIQKNSSGRVRGAEAGPFGEDRPLCPYLDTYLIKADPLNKILENKKFNTRRLQEYLNTRHGANLEIDGKYGRATQEAVGKLQLEYADAILGPWKKMNSKRIATMNVHAMTKAFINYDMGCEEADASWLPGEDRYHRLETRKISR